MVRTLNLPITLPETDAELYHARYVRSLWGIQGSKDFSKCLTTGDSSGLHLLRHSPFYYILNPDGGCPVPVYSPLRDGDTNWDADHTDIGQILLQVYKNAPVTWKLPVGHC
jgi:hypothetical protein